MIKKDQVMSLLLEACPSFFGAWDKYRASESYEPEYLYGALSKFAGHVIELKKTGNLEEFPAVFDVIERLQHDGDDEVKEAASIGLLEDLFDLAARRGVDPNKSFLDYLGPESAEAWELLSEFREAPEGTA